MKKDNSWENIRRFICSTFKRVLSSSENRITLNLVPPSSIRSKHLLAEWLSALSVHRSSSLVHRSVSRLVLRPSFRGIRSPSHRIGDTRSTDSHLSECIYQTHRRSTLGGERTHSLIPTITFTHFRFCFGLEPLKINVSSSLLLKSVCTTVNESPLDIRWFVSLDEEREKGGRTSFDRCTGGRSVGKSDSRYGCAIVVCENSRSRSATD